MACEDNATIIDLFSRAGTERIISEGDFSQEIRICRKNSPTLRGNVFYAG
jgi:hypothetical protein